VERRETINERRGTINKRGNERNKLGEESMKDPLENYPVYVKSMEFYNKMWDDTEILRKDPRGIEIMRQLVRSAGSVCANFEEGYGRGTTKQFLYFLRVSRGSARETKGWYRRSKRLLQANLLKDRINEMDEIIALLASMINTMEIKQKK